MLLSLSLYWFNPFVWILFRLFNKDLEFSCDLATLKTLGQENKAKYANTLVNMEEKRQEANLAGLVFVAFAGDFLKERVLNIMKTKNSKVLSLVFTVIFSLGVFTIFATNAQPISANNGQINVEQAKAIAVEKVGGGEVVKIELDYEKHGAEYEMTVIEGEWRYEVDVNANNGALIKMKRKPIDNIKIPISSDMISAAKAKEIAIAQLGSGVVVDCELEYEHGIAVYDVEVMKDNVKYEYEINAVTGVILRSEVKHYYLP